jgi:hypothetical protein
MRVSARLSSNLIAQLNCAGRFFDLLVFYPQGIS